MKCVVFGNNLSKNRQLVDYLVTMDQKHHLIRVSILSDTLF